MTRVQGMGSTKSTNRNQGGGPSKQGIPSSVGRPANLMRFVMTNSNGGGGGSSIVSSTATACQTVIVTGAGVGGDNAGNSIFFPRAIPGSSNISEGWKISGTITGIVLALDLSDSVNIQLTVSDKIGTIPSTGGNYTFTNC